MGWPKYIKKSYKTKDDLKKMINKRVQLAHSKEFLESLFIKNEGFWKLKKGIPKSDKKKLKKLVKEIKKGRGGVKKLPVLIILLVIAALLIFTLIFKNPLAEKYIELSLANIFGATVEIDSFKISLIKTRVKFDSLEIADKDNLDTNLIQLGFTKFAFDLDALFHKKGVIKNLECQNMGFSTPREKPGKLKHPSSNKKKETASRSHSNEEGFLDFLGQHNNPAIANLSLAAQDPKAFAKDQWDQMQMPEAVMKINDKYQLIIDSYPKRIDKLESSSQEVITEGNEFINEDYSSYLSKPQEIPGLVKKGNSYKDKIIETSQTIQKEINALDELKDSLEEDKNKLIKIQKDDLERMSSLITFPDGGVETLIKGMVQSYIASLLGDKYSKIMKIAGYAKKLQKSKGKFKQKGEKQKKADKGKRQGRIVNFANSLWPDFLLQKALIAAATKELSWELALDDFAGDPNQWNKPITFGVDLIKGKGSMTAKGLIDRRDEPKSPSQGELAFSGFAVSTDALSPVGINKISGISKGNSTLTVAPNYWLSKTNLTLSKVKMSQTSPDQISKLVYRILSKKDWEMTITLEGKENDVSFDLYWPLMDKIEDEIVIILKEQANEFLIEVEKELRNRFKGELTVLEKYTGNIDQYKDLLGGDLSTLGNQKTAVENKISGIENIVEQKINEAKKKAEETAKQEAKRKLEESAAGNILKKSGLKGLFN